MEKIHLLKWSFSLVFPLLGLGQVPTALTMTMQRLFAVDTLSHHCDKDEIQKLSHTKVNNKAFY